jgi:hypothetical protein
MKDKSGKSFELLIQEVFQVLVNQDSVKNINVQHNVVLQGKGTSHQIDVYWEFEQGGIRHRVVVQAKDWQDAVGQRELLAFRGVLDDLPGQPRGVFITRSRFQSGAEEFAKVYGIALFELEEQPPPPVGSIVVQPGSFGFFGMYRRNLHTNEKSPVSFDIDPSQGLFMGFLGFDPQYQGLTYAIDEKWLAKKPKLHQKQVVSQIKNVFVNRPAHEVILYDKNENHIMTLMELLASFIAEMRDTKTRSEWEQTERVERKFTKLFAEPTFLDLGTLPIRFLKIISISTNVILTRRPYIEMQVHLPRIVNVILREISEGSEMNVEIKRGSDNTV